MKTKLQQNDKIDLRKTSIKVDLNKIDDEDDVVEQKKKDLFNRIRRESIEDEAYKGMLEQEVKRDIERFKNPIPKKEAPVKDPAEVEKERKMVEEWIEEQNPSDKPKKWTKERLMQKSKKAPPPSLEGLIPEVEEKPISKRKSPKKWTKEKLMQKSSPVGEPEEIISTKKIKPEVKEDSGTEKKKTVKDEYSKSQVEKEREMAEEWLKKNKPIKEDYVDPYMDPYQVDESIKKEKERELVEKFVYERHKNRKNYVKQKSNEIPKCLNTDHKDPVNATVKLLHGKMLGDIQDPLTFCDSCISSIDIIPIERNEPSPDCMNSDHRTPARSTMKLKHGGMLGEIPDPLTFCDFCISYIEKIPASEDESLPEYSPGEKCRGCGMFNSLDTEIHGSRKPFCMNCKWTPCYNCGNDELPMPPDDGRPVKCKLCGWKRPEDPEFYTETTESKKKNKSKTKRSRKKKSEVILRLVSISNKLDKKGFYEYADSVDSLLSSIVAQGEL
jgi:hypothetical protein